MQQTSNVIDLMLTGQVKRLVYTSSYTTMVPPQTRPEGWADEDDYYQPGILARSAYYECKAAMEKVLFQAENEGIEIVILNPTLVLGPGGKTQGTGAIFLAMARGWGRAWLPAKVNVVDVRDVAQGHLNAVKSGYSGERYMLGGHNLELRQLIDEVAEIAGVRRPWLKLPLVFVDVLVWLEDHIPGVNVFANHLRAIRHWPSFSNEKARKRLNLSFRPLEETLVDTLESYQEGGYL
jgi:dihydroflavonol-4-reductase